MPPSIHIASTSIFFYKNNILLPVDVWKGNVVSHVPRLLRSLTQSFEPSLHEDIQSTASEGKSLKHTETGSGLGLLVFAP